MCIDDVHACVGCWEVGEVWLRTSPVSSFLASSICSLTLIARLTHCTDPTDCVSV